MASKNNLSEEKVAGNRRRSKNLAEERVGCKRRRTSAPKRRKAEAEQWKSVIAEVRKGADKAHIAAYNDLIKRAASLGFDAASVDRTLDYIREHAPLVIHFHPQLLLAKFANCPEYLSRYGGPYYANRTLPPSDPRHVAESKLFGGRYDKLAGRERVKYGALNISGDPLGPKPARGYGSAYLLLKPHVRTRVTISPCDSFGHDPVHVGTPDSFAHMLNHKYMLDSDLRQALQIGSQMAQGDAPPQTTVECVYREIQIHGPVRFAEDVEAVVIPQEERHKNEAAAAAFTKAHNVAVLWV